MLSSDVRTLAQVQSLDRAARRTQVPCGDGAMIWRRWGEGEPVLLLHGGSGSWNHWVRNIGALVAQGRSVWVPDLPGFGESASVPEGENADADNLPVPMQQALLALLGDVPVDVVGFSFGTMVGAFLAAQWPQRVRRLVLCGAPALGIASAGKLLLRPWAHLPPGDALDAVHRRNLSLLMLAQPESIDDLALALHAANMPRDRMKRRRISRTEVMLETLPRLHCPVWGIWGEQDVLYRGSQHLLVPALSHAPDFRGLRLIPEAGHWVQYERAEAFNQALSVALAD